MNWLRDLIKRMGISTLIIFLLSFPILGIIQWIGPNDLMPYDKYKELLTLIWGYINEYGDWIIVTFLSILFIDFSRNYSYTAERVRMNRLLYEVKRWSKTPYISPYLYFNLISPRSSYSGDMKSRVNNEYYKKCVTIFRDRVFVNGAFSRYEPEKMSSWIQVSGYSILIPVVFCLAIIGVFFIYLVQLKSPELWFTGWDKFAIPFIVFISSYIGQLLYACYYIGSFKDIKDDVDAYFQEIGSYIAWRDVYPDRPKGEAIRLAWQYEMNDRKLKYEEFQNGVPGSAPIVECSALAPFPFPSEEIPGWAEKMELDVNDSLKKQANKNIVQHSKGGTNSKGNVISFKRK